MHAHRHGNVVIFAVLVIEAHVEDDGRDGVEEGHDADEHIELRRGRVVPVRAHPVLLHRGVAYGDVKLVVVQSAKVKRSREG